ncbi:cytochrome c3 family protein [Neobacillus mesonae]|uniref:cytochrome c3 family protein n=1 Tax=Neobacillus mesonae TaxID=1193713 RepID=UPI002572BFDE|nr:cytochrome c3 family protein [Neobacillus mesonae]
MKRMNYKRKFVLYVVIWSLFISSFLLYSPETHVFSASGEPKITVTAPAAGSLFEVTTVEFTGIISDEQTPPNELIVKVFEQPENAEQPIDITEDGKLTITPQANFADFTYVKDFSQGVHKITFFVSDQQGFSNKSEQTITVGQSQTTAAAPDGTADSAQPTAAGDNPAEMDGKQPGTVDSGTSEPDQENPSMDQPASNETTGNQLTVKKISNRPYMANMFLIPRGRADQYTPGKKAPRGFLPAEDMTRVPLNYQILIEVRSTGSIPENQPLITVFGEAVEGKEKRIKETKIDEDVTAYVYTFTPEKTFTAGTSYDVYLNPNFKNDLEFNIIPRFLKFTTVSAHHQDVKDFTQGTGEHIADIPDDQRSLDFNIHGNYSNVTNACAYCHSTHNGGNPNLEGGTIRAKEDNLCLACHDGTLSSAGIPEADKYNTSKFKHAQNHLEKAAACTSCHNPHIPGTPANPNSLQSYKVKDQNGIHFEPYTYKKASTAAGGADDFSLCLSCHNKSKNKNIAQYYTNENFTNQSGHNIIKTKDSGSRLKGQLPCAECHETHGSNNIKMLREDLGNIQPDENLSKFSKTSGRWNAAAERQFCLACHKTKNNTVLYGRTAKFNKTIIEHQGKDLVCSQCHGGESKTFIEAAHAPSITNQTPNAEPSASELDNPVSP